MRRAARPLLALAVLLLSLGAAELASRVVVRWRTPPGMVFDPEIIYSYRSHTTVGSMVLNDVGCVGDDVEAMVDAASAAGTRAVLCSFAVALPTDDHELEARVRSQEPVMEHFWGRVDSTLLGVEAHNRAMAEIAARRGLQLAPVASLMPRDSEHFLDLCHLTADGNRILGEAVADAVAGSAQ